MAITAAVVESAFKAARTALSGAAITVRWGGAEVSGIRSAPDFVDAFGMGGAIQGVSGAVRLCVSELVQPYPVAGDTIDVEEPQSTQAVTREVIHVRYDQTGATMLVSYGERHG
jgi:hypothetical protein